MQRRIIRIRKNPGAILVTHVRSNKLGRLYGDVDTLFGRYDVRRPDLIYFSKKRLDLVGEKAMEGPPDLCVEIVSPSSRLIDRRDKFKQYARGKVAYYWIVDPEEHTAEAFKLIGRAYKPTGSGKGQDVVAFPPFPDLKIPLGEIWQPDQDPIEKPDLISSRSSYSSCAPGRCSPWDRDSVWRS